MNENGPNILSVFLLNAAIRRRCRTELTFVSILSSIPSFSLFHFRKLRDWEKWYTYIRQHNSSDFQQWQWRGGRGRGGGVLTSLVRFYHVKNIPNPFCPLIDTFKILLWYIFPFKMHPFFQTFIHDLFKSRQTSKTLGSKETRFSLHLRASPRAVSVTIFTISIFEVLYRLPFAK